MDEPQSIAPSVHDFSKALEEFSRAIQTLQNKEDFEDESGQAFVLLDQYACEYDPGSSAFYTILIRAVELGADIESVLPILHSYEDKYQNNPTNAEMSDLPDHTRDRADTAEKVAQFILSIAEEQDERPKALPLMCGTGKSSSLSYVIRHMIQNNKGLIIVTDQVERMHSYVEKRPGEDDELKQFLKKNRNKVTILESGSTYKRAWENRDKTPVLILTTQRYFNELDQDGLNSLFEWDGGKRDLIVFDEMPYMKCFDYIGNEQINKVLTALQNAINDENPREKTWCVDQWRSFSKLIDDQLNVYYNVYRKQKTTYFIYSHPTHHITRNDRRFWYIIDKNRVELQARYKDAYRNLQAIRKLVESPTLVYCEKRLKQTLKQFIVETNNMNRIVDIPAKAIILDGTANLSPEYQQSGIETVKCDEFNRSLNRLQVRLVNIKATNVNFLKN